MDPVTALQLAEWRREIAALYARVRGHADPEAAHALWRDGRGRLLRSHPQSPLPPGDPMRVRGVPYWPYDPALRWTVPVEPVTRPQQLAIDTGPDGVTHLEQAGWVTLPDPDLRNCHRLRALADDATEGDGVNARPRARATRTPDPVELARAVQKALALAQRMT